MKTRKSIKKRFRITKNGKVLRRAVGHCHSRAKKSGKERRELRKSVLLGKVEAKKIKKLLR
jgi:large subunit ribosomal protein L35